MVKKCTGWSRISVQDDELAIFKATGCLHVAHRSEGWKCIEMLYTETRLVILGPVLDYGEEVHWLVKNFHPIQPCYLSDNNWCGGQDGKKQKRNDKIMPRVGVLWSPSFLSKGLRLSIKLDIWRTPLYMWLWWSILLLMSLNPMTFNIFIWSNIFKNINILMV